MTFLLFFCSFEDAASYTCTSTHILKLGLFPTCGLKCAAFLVSDSYWFNAGTDDPPAAFKTYTNSDDFAP